jgi:hypothetical protein
VLCIFKAQSPEYMMTGIIVRFVVRPASPNDKQQALLPHTTPPLTPSLKLLLPVSKPTKDAHGRGRLTEGCGCSRRPKAWLETPL